MPSQFLSSSRQNLGYADATSDDTPENAGHLTAQIRNARITGRSISGRYYGEKSADVRFQNVDLEATEDSLDLYIKGGSSKWIVGQTKDSIKDMNRADLFELWEDYRLDGRNQSIKGIGPEALREDYDDTPEGLAKLRKFIVGYLAVSNGENAD